MLDHTGIVVTDLAAARRFYDAIAKPLGLATAENGPESFLFGKSAEEPIPYLWIGTLRSSYWVEGSRAGLNQMHIAFIALSKGRRRRIPSRRARSRLARQWCVRPA